ncbi:MAG: hypothetical protein R2716_06475 [Microthrixaceae bacterium]
MRHCAHGLRSTPAPAPLRTDVVVVIGALVAIAAVTMWALLG